jgi:catechol-2,3-dioxygenase
MFEKGKKAGIDTRGISDHHFIDSIYFRDPNGYVIELTAKRPNHDAVMKAGASEARPALDTWQKEKRVHA